MIHYNKLISIMNKKHYLLTYIPNAIPLSFTFDNILTLIESNFDQELICIDFEKPEISSLVALYRERTMSYLGPRPRDRSAHGFAFYITCSAHTNNGEPTPPQEGYEHLPYNTDKIICDPCNNLDWYNFGLADFLENVSLSTSDSEIANSLDEFLKKGAVEHEGYGYPLISDYKKKLIKTREFIVRRISEYREIIKQMVNEVYNAR